MRVAIIGTGAMGSVYAGLMGAAGVDVWAIDTWPAHIDAIRSDGLRVSGASGDKTVKLNASQSVADAGPIDLAIIATKASGVEAAAHAVKPVLAKGGTVLTIQNGVGSAEKVAAIVGSEKVLIGVVGGFGASIPKPGHAHHNGWEFVRLGEYAGGMTDRLEQVGKVWESAGFKVLKFPDIHRMVWEKLICNIAYSGPCTLTGLTIGEVINSPDAFRISAGCATEAFEMAKAQNIAVEIDEPVKYVLDFGLKIPGARPSMLLDHMAGKKSEIDVINGAIPPLGDRFGIETPFNDVVVSLVKGKETLFKS